MLIPFYHVIPATYPVDSAATSIKKGQVVTLTTDGTVKLADGSNAATEQPLGLAGDSVGTLTAGQFVNRVSDYGNDTGASGQITVYQNGGQFYVDYEDCFVTGYSATTGELLVLSTDPGLMDTAPADATIWGVASGKQIVARVVDDLAATQGALPTGIPGEYEPSGSHEDIELSGASNYPGNGGPVRAFCRIQLLI